MLPLPNPIRYLNVNWFLAYNFIRYMLSEWPFVYFCIFYGVFYFILFYKYFGGIFFILYFEKNGKIPMNQNSLYVVRFMSDYRL